MMQFFVWFDDSTKLPAVEKIQAAVAAYVERFKTRPNLVLVNAIDQTEMRDVTVRSTLTVQPNTFWVGHEVNTDVRTS